MNTSQTILVVEDIAIQQKVVQFILDKLGCSYEFADTGQQAITLFKQNRYGLILMDIGLPDINGMEVTKKIRELENQHSHVPIVALTANYDESYKPMCLAIGMDDFVIKPLTQEKATYILAKFLRFEK